MEQETQKTSGAYIVPKFQSFSGPNKIWNLQSNELLASSFHTKIVLSEK